MFSRACIKQKDIPREKDLGARQCPLDGPPIFRLSAEFFNTFAAILRTVALILSRKSTGSITSAWSPTRGSASPDQERRRLIVNSIPAWPFGRISCDLCH